MLVLRDEVLYGSKPFRAASVISAIKRSPHDIDVKGG
jgi:hypothetical protein